MIRFPQNASRVLIKRKIEDEELQEDFAQSNASLIQRNDEVYLNRFPARDKHRVWMRDDIRKLKTNIRHTF